MLICLFILAVYMILSVYLEQWKVVFSQVTFVHESGISIILGFIAGLVLNMVSFKQTGNEPDKFDSSVFFSFMLPFLILSAGYNMKRKRFFRNLGSIFLFGVLGTILCFVLIGFGAYQLSEFGWIVDLEGQTMKI